MFIKCSCDELFYRRVRLSPKHPLQHMLKPGHHIVGQYAFLVNVPPPYHIRHIRGHNEVCQFINLVDMYVNADKEIKAKAKQYLNKYLKSHPETSPEIVERIIKANVESYKQCNTQGVEMDGEL